MGVRGLQSFMRDNRSTLSRSVVLDRDNKEPVPVVVDAWGIIYRLYLDSLPWTTGGEYLAFYRLARRLVLAWRSVGLKPIFVFDGASPATKHETLLGRLQSNVATCRLFYTTSPASRSSPSFARQSALLPPFASHAFVCALESLGAETRFVPAGEADGVCVALAAAWQAYVIGQDSDFAILVNGADGARGYCPIDQMTWIEGGDGEHADLDAPDGRLDGWETAAASKKPTRQRQSTLLPLHQLRRPRLVLLAYPPSGLRDRLRLPAALVPLLASLVGNDHIPAYASSLFFEAHLSPGARVEKAARVMREQVGLAAGKSRGEQAADYVARVVGRLASRHAFVSAAFKQQLVDAIIEATFAYALPPDVGYCCARYPFCGALDRDAGACRSSPGDGGASDEDRARAAFAAAQRRGAVAAVVSVYLNPDRIYIWSVLEDPSGPAHKASPLNREIRATAYSYIEHALGGLRWAGHREGTDGLEVDVEADREDAEDRALRKLLGADEKDVASEASSATASHDGNGDGDAAADDSRTILEYIRQGSSDRIAEYAVRLPPVPATTPPCLLPLPARLELYLAALRSATPAILALDAQLHPLVAAVRACVLSASARAEAHRWRRAEVAAVLRAGLGALAAWAHDPRASECRAAAAAAADDDAAVELTQRAADIVAQLAAALADAHVLAQALLLVDTGDGEPLTHGAPWVFVSGLAIHALIAGKTPGSSTWRWGEKEEATYAALEAAFWDGSDEGAVVGAAGVVTEKKKSKKKGGSKGGAPKQAQGGRFAALNGMH
ncbi:hypothetical protein Q5752_006229 [Cryptotrichosporon argae]